MTRAECPSPRGVAFSLSDQTPLRQEETRRPAASTGELAGGSARGPAGSMVTMERAVGLDVASGSRKQADARVGGSPVLGSGGWGP